MYQSYRINTDIILEDKYPYLKFLLLGTALLFFEGFFLYILSIQDVVLVSFSKRAGAYSTRQNQRKSHIQILPTDELKGLWCFKDSKKGTFQDSKEDNFQVNVETR